MIKVILFLILLILYYDKKCLYLNLLDLCLYYIETILYYIKLYFILYYVYIRIQFSFYY